MHKILLTALFFFAAFSLFGQSGFVANSSVNIVVLGGTTVNVQGTITLKNSSTVDNKGKINLTEDWINNAGNTGLINSSPGEVELLGDTQYVDGTSVTNFYGLTLSGTGVKILQIDAITEDTLNLNDRELATYTNTMFVTNTDTGAIQRTTGFVSSLNTGYLSRSMLSAQPYNFPLGSSDSIPTLYRPLDLTPSTAAAQTMEARFGNLIATAEGYDVMLKDSSLCTVNPDYYHQINRNAGTDPVGITMYYDNVADLNGDNIAQWQSSSLWSSLGVVSIVSNTSPTLSTIAKATWNDFSEIAFAIASSALSNSLASTDALCGNNTGTATAAVSGGQSPYTYLWSNADTSATADSLLAGTYYVTVTDGGACTKIDSVTIIGSGNISDTITSVDVNCFGGSDGTATVTPGGGTAPYTYLWSNSDTGSTADSLTVGIYYVTVTDSNSCVAIDSVTINEPTAPMTTSVTPVDESCNGGDGLATVAPSGGTSPYAYSWSNGDTSAVADSLSVGTYFVTVTDLNSCTATDSATINSSTGLGVTMSFTDITCNGNIDGTATATPANGISPFTYVWTNGDTTTTADSLAVGTYLVTVTDSGGCFTVDSVTINEPAALTSSLTNTDDTCNSTNGTATVTAGGGILPYNYLWSNGDTIITADSLAAGMHYVTITDSNACSIMDSVNVSNVGSAPTLNVSTTDATCSGSADGTATVTPLTGTAPYTYTWSNGDTSSLADSLTVGDHYVTLTDANGCQAMDTATVADAGGGPVLTTIESVSATCAGSADGVAITTPSGGVAPYTYLWDTNANSQTDSTATGLSAGTYYVTVSDWASCFAIDSVGIIDAGSGPNSTSSANNASCSQSTDGNATVIASGGAGAPYSYLWDTNAGSQTASEATGLSTGTYLVTITDQGSCTTIDSVTVSNAGLGPIVSAGSDTTIALGESAQLNGSGGPTYAWTPSATLNCSDCDNPVATPDSTTTYFLTVTDSNNCTSSDSVIVTVETFVDELFVPTLFSPNADQMNDIFYVRGNGIDWIEIVIYDRWGKKIYGGDKSQVWAEDNNYPTDKGWDGSYQGKPLNPAVFVYIIKGAFDSGAEIEEKGNITLVR